MQLNVATAATRPETETALRTSEPQIATTPAPRNTSDTQDIATIPQSLGSRARAADGPHKLTVDLNNKGVQVPQGTGLRFLVMVPVPLVPLVTLMALFPTAHLVGSALMATNRD